MHSSAKEEECEDWKTWLRLMQTPGVGVGTARKLLLAFGLPERIFNASFVDLRQCVDEKIAHALSQTIAIDIQRQIEITDLWLDQPNNHIVCLADAQYPKLLLEIPDPPILLYVKGQVELLGNPSIAIVGSRNATAQGISNAERFAESLSRGGLCVSSGLAAGIDAAAHTGGLRGKASTIAVIGTGADVVYPARNRELAHAIANGGCIVSEYPLGTSAIASNFPRRNRIISGLAKGVLVIEAAEKSGSLITSRLALEQGREVFAIPGSIHSPLAKGCHQLIKQGAKLVESAQDIFDEIGLQEVSFEKKIAHIDKSTNEAATGILQIIGYDPVHIDVLQLRGNYSIADLSAHLFELELAGSIETLPGGMVQRVG
jgi:DNA processing protein